MGILHRATISPTKAELVSAFIPTRSWGPAVGDTVELIGSFRVDDPEGAVGIEVLLATAGNTLFQVPLTYRDAPLDGADDALVAEMEHSALGTRWVYDGLRDPRCVLMLAATSLTGQGEAIGLAEVDGRWLVSPAVVRIHGGGWGHQPVPVDGFKLESDEAGGSVLRNDRFVLTVFRRPAVGPSPAIGLTATWSDHPDHVVLTEVIDTTA